MYLAQRGVDAVHVRDVGLGQDSDETIAAWAIAEQRVVISKDEDFVLISDLHGEPRIVWVRLGNCRNHELCSTFDRCWNELHQSLEAGQRIVLVS